ncbi:MAG: phenylacetic acid degradation protein [Sulfobacillus thermosulfidooxidans]|nr:MAG: phenylacetic acid degradation protein [Sulfobacillus thermosulfidooxidans]
MNPQEIPVYEVFVQADALSFPTHVGSLRAASPAFALQLAKETFCRREDAHDVWVVPSQAISRARRDATATLPTTTSDKRYRLPSGYDNAPHWKRFKAQAMTIEEVAADMRTKGR